MKDIIYIATVGTGIAARGNSVAHAILFGIRSASPGNVYLVPSSSPASLAVAARIASEADVTPFADDSPYFTLTDAEDLDRCVAEMSFLLSRLSWRHADATLILNPTSGTKQMTTAAYVAAVDEGVEHIEYITGERVDGVVTPGTERVVRTSGRRARTMDRAHSALTVVVRAPISTLIVQTGAGSHTDALPAGCVPVAVSADDT